MTPAPRMVWAAPARICRSFSAWLSAYCRWPNSHCCCHWLWLMSSCRSCIRYAASHWASRALNWSTLRSYCIPHRSRLISWARYCWVTPSSASAFSNSPWARSCAISRAVSDARRVRALFTAWRFRAAVFMMLSYWAAPMPPRSPRTSAYRAWLSLARASSMSIWFCWVWNCSAASRSAWASSLTPWRTARSIWPWACWPAASRHWSSRSRRAAVSARTAWGSVWSVRGSVRSAVGAAPPYSRRREARMDALEFPRSLPPWASILA